MSEANPTPICPRCGHMFLFRQDEPGDPGYWVCHQLNCPNNPATVTTLLDENGRPTNMRGWRRGLTHRGNPAPRPPLTIEQILQLEG